MNYPALYRLSGAAAVTGGALRMIVAFPLTNDAIMLEWLYAGIDALLLMGLIGIYLNRAERLGFWASPALP